MASIESATGPTAVKTHQTSSEQLVDEDDRELLNLGYKAVLARGWGGFDNFACSFSALYCIGGIRVLFYIALSEADLLHCEFIARGAA